MKPYLAKTNRRLSLIFLFIPFMLTSGSAKALIQDGEIKLLTYNIWNGYDWGKDSVRRSQVQQWIHEQKADVIALQELCNYTSEKLAEDAKSWGHEYSVLLKTSL